MDAGELLRKPEAPQYKFDLDERPDLALVGAADPTQPQIAGVKPVIVTYQDFAVQAALDE